MSKTEELKNIIQTYYTKVLKYKPRKITIKKKSIFKQDALNCWIFSVMNNLYLNTGIIISWDELRNYMNSFGINTSVGGINITSGVLVCDFLKQNRLCFYEINVLKQTKLFAELLLAGYSFVYSRDCSNTVLSDIRDNGKIDKVHKGITSGHATNITFERPNLKELGSWGDDSRYNEFVFGSTDIFIKCVKAGAIKPEVRFLDFKQ